MGSLWRDGQMETATSTKLKMGNMTESSSLMKVDNGLRLSMIMESGMVDQGSTMRTEPFYLSHCGDMAP